MSRQITRHLAVACTALAAIAMQMPVMAQYSNQQRQEPVDLVVSSQNTLQDFMNDPQMAWFQQNIGRAKGVLFAPEVGKVGFIVSGSGGRALLLVKGKDGKWTGPAFYTLTTGTVAVPAGVVSSQTALLVMTDKGVNALMSPSLRLGGDASIAAGPAGAGAKSDSVADFVTFSRSKGVYGGVNFDGTVVKSNDDWNAAYYNAPATTPSAILMAGKVTNRDSTSLLNAVTKAAGGK